jgi:DNA primase
MRMPSSDARASLERKVAAYNANVAGALPYLTDRGITAETADRFRLGVDPTGRLVIPYLSPAGPWHLKYRCITGHDCKTEGHGKYGYDPGSEQHLFNAQTLLDAERVVVTEGELDAIAVEQAGMNAVAYPGAETWAKCKHWRWCFDSVVEIVVVADGDQPGRKAAGAVCDSLRLSAHADVRVVVLPDGHDSNSFINEYGDLAYLEELEWL